jgi:hypothetical protein
MSSGLTALVAREHVNELRRRAERRGPKVDGFAKPHAGTIELRLARADETSVVRRLAALDDAAELEGRVLLALIDGVAVAALSAQDQRVVANPFVPTEDAVTLLRLRAEHVLAPRKHRRRLLHRGSRLRVA